MVRAGPVDPGCEAGPELIYFSDWLDPSSHNRLLFQGDFLVSVRGPAVEVAGMWSEMTRHFQ